MAELADSLTPVDNAARLDQAESLVRDRCGWHIAPSRTETVKIFGAPLNTPILLPSMYVTEIVSVTDQGTLVDPSLYDFEQAGILRRTDGGAWTAGYGAIVVTFTHGYEVVPPAVTRVVQSLAAVLPNGLKSKQAGPFAESYFDDLPAVDRAALGRYRLPVGP